MKALIAATVDGKIHHTNI